MTQEAELTGAIYALRKAIEAEKYGKPYED